MMSLIPVSAPLRRALLLEQELTEAFRAVLKKGNYILGEEVDDFEKEYARFTNRKHCIAVANGTDALILSLKALDIGEGDEVITTAHSAVATAASICLAGATPIFGDIEPLYRCICPSEIKKLITNRTKAIIPVHIYGHPANMTEILKIAIEYNLHIIEDCAQAHGATWANKQVGSFGKLAAFSFYPTKNLGTLGDGGAIVTDDSDLAERLKSLRQYGWKTRYISSETGMNSRLDEVHAAMLRIFLKKLNQDNLKRRSIAQAYNQSLSNQNKIINPAEHNEAQSVYHLYVIETDQPNQLAQYLLESGIATARHYPLPIHQQPAYSQKKIILPNTEKLYSRMLTIPMFPELTEHEIDLICQALINY
jgi:dTDP-4-amino-4,6-dideoxygalactose transaminase